MAERTIKLGSLEDVILYDDVDFPDGLFSDGPIRTSNAPASANDVIRQADVGGGGIAAPSDAHYVVITADSDLSDERVLAVANGLKKTDGGAGGSVTIEIDATAKPTMAGSTNTDHVDVDADSKALRLGADQDATVLYDGTDLLINPKAVGTGKMTVSGVVNTTESYQVDGTKVIGNQEAAIASLTDSTGGTANNTVQALTDPVDSPLTADALRDDLVANLIPELRNNYADLTAKINTILTALRNHGLIAT